MPKTSATQLVPVPMACAGTGMKAPEKKGKITMNDERIKRTAEVGDFMPEKKKRLDYFKKGFLTGLLDSKPVRALEREEPPSSFWVDQFRQTAIVETASLTITDTKFTGETIQQNLKDIIDNFSAIVLEAFNPKQELQENFARERARKIKEGIITCSKCRNVVPSGSNFCPNYGAPIH